MKKCSQILVVLLCYTTAALAQNKIAFDPGENNANEIFTSDKLLVGGLCVLFFALGGVAGYMMRGAESRKRRKKGNKQGSSSSSAITTTKFQSVKVETSTSNNHSKVANQSGEKQEMAPLMSPPSQEYAEQQPSPIHEWGKEESKSKTQPTVSTMVMYFPNPASGGVFRKKDGRDSFIDGASIYKFTLTSAGTADFEFCADRSSVAIALNNRNELILSVADELTPYDPHAGKLRSEPNERGKAMLEGNDWIVKTKAKITYV